MRSDSELLRQYATAHSEEAFAELVRRAEALMPLLSDRDWI